MVPGSWHCQSPEPHSVRRFEIVVPEQFTLVFFRLNPNTQCRLGNTGFLKRKLLDWVNSTDRVYMTRSHSSVSIRAAICRGGHPYWWKPRGCWREVDHWHVWRLQIMCDCHYLEAKDIQDHAIEYGIRNRLPNITRLSIFKLYCYPYILWAHNIHTACFYDIGCFGSVAKQTSSQLEHMKYMVIDLTSDLRPPWIISGSEICFDPWNKDHLAVVYVAVSQCQWLCREVKLKMVIDKCEIKNQVSCY